MANATAKAESSTTPYEATKIKWNLSVGTATTYYPGTMIAINSAGAAVKCADGTAGLQFAGIMADSFRIVVDGTETLGDKVVNIDRPFRFTMKIASAAITDIGRAVYALYDNEVAYSGVSNSILVGWVDAYIDATTVLIRPTYAGIRGDASFDGETLTFDGTTGANTVVVPDNLADGLSIVEGANPYLTFITTNSSEQMLASKKLSFLDATDVVFGTGLDALMRWSTGDASDHSLVIALGDTSQMLHITDKAAVATDWALSSPTHPTVLIHSNTTPATDYLLIGGHDGTTANIDVVGGTTLAMKVAGTAYAGVNATGAFLGTYVAAGTAAGTSILTMQSTGTAPTGTGADVGHLYADFETDDDELFWLSGTGGTATQLTT